MCAIFIIIFIIWTMYQYTHHAKSPLEILHPEWFDSSIVFPNDHSYFTCSKNCKNYWMKVIDGYNKMANKKVIIAGLCINIENKISKLKQKLEHIGGFFKDYKCVIFENDSTDKTRLLLKKLTRENKHIELVECEDAPDCKYKVASAIEHGAISDKRMEKMSKYRNKLLDHIKNKYLDYDCVIMMDLDFRGPIEINGIANSFGYYNEWDTISAFGLFGLSLTNLGDIYPTYYDTLAYNDGIYSAYNGDEHINNIITKLNTNRIGDDPIKVLSGFGGLAIYKMNILKNPNINYTPHDGKYVCEHYLLHNNMIKHGFDKIYINPNMVLLV